MSAQHNSTIQEVCITTLSLYNLLTSSISTIRSAQGRRETKEPTVETTGRQGRGSGKQSCRVEKEAER